MSISICIEEGMFIFAPVILVWLMLSYIISAGVVAMVKLFKVIKSISPSSDSSAVGIFLEVMVVGGIVAVFEFIAFPVTTIYYFVKSRKETEQSSEP